MNPRSVHLAAVPMAKPNPRPTAFDDASNYLAKNGFTMIERNQNETEYQHSSIKSVRITLDPQKNSLFVRIFFNNRQLRGLRISDNQANIQNELNELMNWALQYTIEELQKLNRLQILLLMMREIFIN